jgi:hypothetical protein
MNSSGGTRGSRAELSQERENGRNRQEGSHKHCDLRASLRRTIVNRAASSRTALKELGEALVELAAGIEAKGELRHNLRSVVCRAFLKKPVYLRSIGEWSVATHRHLRDGDHAGLELPIGADLRTFTIHHHSLPIVLFA